jgi:hypothetical protein
LSIDDLRFLILDIPQPIGNPQSKIVNRAAYCRLLNLKIKSCVNRAVCVAYTARFKTISLWRRKMRIRRSMRKKPLRRPTKKAGPKRYRIAQQKKRLATAGVTEAVLRRMTNKDIRESLMKNQA